MKRIIITCVLVAALLAGAWTMITLPTPAQALTVSGSDLEHQWWVYRTVCSQPKLLGFVHDVYPDFYVRIGYAGHAWPDGFMDVNLRLEEEAFGELVGHEFGHMVQLAGDTSGLAVGEAWLQLLRDRGYPDEVWVWDVTEAPYYGRMNPWEAFAENVRRAHYRDFSVRQYPNTCLVWLQPSEVEAFLVECGVLQ